MRRAALATLTIRSPERSSSPVSHTAVTIERRSDAIVLLEGEHVVALLLDLQRQGVELVVRLDQVEGAVHVAREQPHRCRGG